MEHRADNDEVADIFDEVADILEFQKDNPFRVFAYRRAARQIQDLDESIRRLYEREGIEGLRYIDGVGEGLSGSIVEILNTGQLGLLGRLKAEISPIDVFSRLPGVGETLAERIVEHLEVESLEELERAAHDGRLERVPGIGENKAVGIGHALAGMLNRGARRRARSRVSDEEPTEPPSVAWILEIDTEYRRRARAGQLRRIAPRRNNPEQKRWLPVMEMERGGYHFTALFSNTRRAHDLGRTHDWVIIYVDRSDGPQYTVVTATSGDLRDKRVVRGREAECRDYYQQRQREPQARRH